MSKEGILSILAKNRKSAAIPSFDILRFIILRFYGSIFPGSAVCCSTYQLSTLADDIADEFFP
jgi:hypothetical protein